MCLSDWRLGRLIRTKARLVTSAASPGTIINADQQRVGISFCLNNPDVTLPSNVDIFIDGVCAFNLSAADPYRKLTLANDGDMPTRQFGISTVSISNIVRVVEQWLPENVLSAGLAEFTSKYKF